MGVELVINEKLIYENSKGQSIQLGNEKPFILVNVAGTGNTDVDVQTQKAPRQDGSTYIDSLMEPRDISITALILAENQKVLFQKRAELQSVFNPKLPPGKLIYDYGDNRKEIEATVSSTPAFLPGEERTSISQLVQIELTCPLPFWLSELTQEEPMAAFVGMFMFPLEIPEEEGVEIGAQGEQRIIENKGDVSAPVKIEFRGPALNPRIQNNTTGEFIQVNQELQSGESLHINTAFGKKRVEIEDEEGDRTNAFNWIDLDSAFWQLEPGENELEYSADTGQDDATVTIRWRERFVGV